MKTSHNMCTSKILTIYVSQNKKQKQKLLFQKGCLQCIGNKNVLIEHKEVCLSINGAQSVRLEKETTKFKNLFKQIQVPFEIYSDLECILNSVESYEGSCTKHIKMTFLVILLTHLFVLMINLVNQLLFTEVKMLLINLLKQFLKSMNTVKSNEKTF